MYFISTNHLQGLAMDCWSMKFKSPLWRPSSFSSVRGDPVQGSMDLTINSKSFSCILITFWMVWREKWHVQWDVHSVSHQGLCVNYFVAWEAIRWKAPSEGASFMPYEYHHPKSVPQEYRLVCSIKERGGGEQVTVCIPYVERSGHITHQHPCTHQEVW